MLISFFNPNINCAMKLTLPANQIQLLMALVCIYLYTILTYNLMTQLKATPKFIQKNYFSPNQCTSTSANGFRCTKPAVAVKPRTAVPAESLWVATTRTAVPAGSVRVATTRQAVPAGSVRVATTVPAGSVRVATRVPAGFVLVNSALKFCQANCPL